MLDGLGQELNIGNYIAYVGSWRTEAGKIDSFTPKGIRIKVERLGRNDVSTTYIKTTTQLHKVVKISEA